MEFQPCDNSKVLLIRAETYLTISGRAIQVSKVLRHDCYPCSSFSQMATEQLATVVKEEPPEEEPEVSSFSYETVTKEEVILDEDGELVENADQPESVREHPTEISQERPFKCPECDRTFAKAGVNIAESLLVLSMISLDTRVPTRKEQSWFSLMKTFQVRNKGHLKKIHRRRTIAQLLERIKPGIHHG
uniref:(northern house mosquito) hypothetical protein n=2 Tax=Culex pipiens TaxID=7175 RepID=A0A8D8KVJ8_CULPI